MSIPNIISIARLLAVPAIIWMILTQQLSVAFWLFLAAGVSDALDGIIAKHFHMETVLGAFLDPLADKALLIGVYVTLGYQGQLAAWLVILVVFRDLLILGGAILYHTITRSLEMAPLMVSKVNTVAQISLSVVVLGGDGFGFDTGATVMGLSYVVGATTFVSGAVYLVTWSERAAEIEAMPDHRGARHGSDGHAVKSDTDRGISS